MKKIISVLIGILVFCSTIAGFSAYAAEPVIVDNFDDWSKISDRSDGWQIDKTVSNIGSMINKCGNNEVQFITYKLDGVKTFTLSITSFISDMSSPKADVKVYISNDNATWTQIKIEMKNPKTVAEGWRIFESTPADVLPDGTAYVKFELQTLNIDEVANCFVTGLQKVALFNVAEEKETSSSVSGSDKSESSAGLSSDKTESTQSTVSSSSESQTTQPSGGITNSQLILLFAGMVVLIAASCTVTAIIINKKNKK